jgi:hypothetical protein
MRNTLENGIPVYKSMRYEYIRVSDLKEEFERNELDRWVYGRFQPLIQGMGKGVPAILDAVFLSDYLEFMELKKLALDKKGKL